MVSWKFEGVKVINTSFSKDVLKEHSTFFENRLILQLP